MIHLLASSHSDATEPLQQGPQNGEAEHGKTATAGAEALEERGDVGRVQGRIVVPREQGGEGEQNPASYHGGRKR